MSIKKASVKQWSCPRCSFNNPQSTYPVCERCHKTDDQLSNSDRSSSAKWQCPSCTLINAADRERCAACDKAKAPPKPNDATLVNSASSSLTTSTSLAIRDRRHNDRSDAEHKFQQISSYCQKARIHFVDDQFVPSARSVGPDSFGNVTQWLRISEIRPLSDDDRNLPWSVFSSASPSDIQQGALGNCWLMAALSLVAERPRMLKHILLTQTVNNEGIYLVRICHNGLWQTILVDDCFPCTIHKQLAFTQARRRQLYVPLIEKACAKLFGCYANLKSGKTAEGLQLLTGAPCQYLDLNPSDRTLDGDIVWAKLLSACESKLLIGVSSSRADVSDSEYSRVRIHNNHAFSVLSAQALSGCSSRFVLVRDPYAHSYYTDDQVTPAVLKILCSIHNEHLSTGAFWISWPRFLRYFSSLTISTYVEDHFDVRLQTKFTRSTRECVPTFRFDVTQTSLVNVSLVSHRHDRTTYPDHTQSFVLCDIDDQSSIGKGENILRSRRGGFLYWIGSLRPGSYVLIPFSTSFWQSDATNRDLTLVIHSSAQLDVTVANQPATLLSDCLISAVIKSCHKPTKMKEAVFYVTSNEIQSRLFVAENSSTTHNLNVDINMSESRNVRHSRHCLVTHDCVPPHHRQLIFIAEWIEQKGQSATMSYQSSYGFDRQFTNSIPPIDTSKHDLHTPRLF